MRSLEGRRVLVVGASSGIGQGIAVGLAERGASLALAARRVDRLTETAARSAGRGVVVPCDVLSEDDCTRVVAEAADWLGGLDVLVYAAGTAKFVEAARTTAGDWHATLGTNVIGAALVTGAALPHLEASEGNAIFLSSVSARHFAPWVGTATYFASKRALEALVKSFRLEHPDVAFTTLVVGPTSSEFGTDDFESVVRFSADWTRKDQITRHDLLEPSDHARVVVEILTSEARTVVSEVVVEPR